LRRTNLRDIELAIPFDELEHSADGILILNGPQLYGPAEIAAFWIEFFQHRQTGEVASDDCFA